MQSHLLSPHRTLSVNPNLNPPYPYYYKPFLTNPDPSPDLTYPNSNPNLTYPNPNLPPNATYFHLILNLSNPNPIWVTQLPLSRNPC